MRAGLGPEEKGGLAFSGKGIKDKEEERER